MTKKDMPLKHQYSKSPQPFYFKAYALVNFCVLEIWWQNEYKLASHTLKKISDNSVTR